MKTRIVRRNHEHEYLARRSRIDRRIGCARFLFPQIQRSINVAFR